MNVECPANELYKVHWFSSRYHLQESVLCIGTDLKEQKLEHYESSTLGGRGGGGGGVGSLGSSLIEDTKLTCLAGDTLDLLTKDRVSVRQNSRQ